MADLLDTLRAFLADRYAIDRELGRGGMATVYLAEDLKHHRRVAIKVLRGDVAAWVGSDRFLREIQIAAQLQHPHILDLHDSGEAGELLYYVMPFVDGETLRDRLDRDGPLAVDEAIRLTTEIADALAYAHRHGVIHRDIKPENILLSGSRDEGTHALVSDFGIARPVASTSGETLTQAGVAVGTPSYMSPEQASAERDVDGRADIYSLGCVLYEMLTGHPPFLGSTAQEILARHARDPIPPLRTARPDLPPMVEQVARKALAKTAADRYATASAFQRALAESQRAVPSRGPLLRGVAASVAVAAVALGWFLVARTGRTGARGMADGNDEPSIAVLPFENVGGSPSDEPFSDGVAEDLTTELRKIGRLHVRARTSAFAFKGRDLTALDVGKRLGVRYVVTGSVHLSGSRRRVNTQLTEVATGNELWSDKYDSDASADNVFAVQDTITRAIAASLRVPLSAKENALLEKRSTRDGEAHDLYLQGRYFFEKRDSVSLAKAQDFFKRAIRLDSSYAQAYAGLSDALSHSAVFAHVPRRVVHAPAKAAARRALALDSGLVEGHVALGFVALFLEWDPKAADSALVRALALDPRNAAAHLFHGWYYVAVGKPADGVREVQTALRLDPISPVINSRMVTMLYFARRYDDAIAQARHTLDMDSTLVSAVGEYARALVLSGRCREAVEAYTNASREQVGMVQMGMVGYAYARCGDPARARAELDYLRGLTAQGKYLAHYGRAMVYTGLGEKGAALDELERAADDVEWPLFTARLDPALDDLRNEARFEQVLARVKPTP